MEGVGDRKIRVWDGETMFYIDGKSGIPEIRGSKLSIMPSTGILDKNGKEIYEGDIIEWWWRVLFEDGYGYTRQREVLKYEQNWNDFDDTIMAHSFDVNPASRIVVIGNVFESPDVEIGEEEFDSKPDGVMA